MFDTTRRQYVSTTARLGSCEAAAKELFVSRAAISRAILQEEQEVGTPLFNRVGHKMLTTSAGEKYLHVTEKINGMIEDYRRQHDIGAIAQVAQA